jgi:hypothetical protein
MDGKTTRARKTTAARSPRKPAAKARPAAAPKRASGTKGSRRVDERIRAVGGWRADVLADVRRMIREADPEITEDCKWAKASNPLGVPVWSHGGIVCTGEAYKAVVKLTFACGASLDDPGRLFNASLDAGTRRAIDIREGESLDPKAFKALIQAAVAKNLSRAR